MLNDRVTERLFWFKLPRCFCGVRMRKLLLVACSLLTTFCLAQTADKLSPAVKAYVSVEAPVIALTHVRVIDGTGAAAREDQTVVISGGKIIALGPAATTTAPAGAKIIDLSGRSVIPGLVGMHDHLFYPTGTVPIYAELAFSAPRMYLGGGVTTIRTTGSLEPYTDLSLWQDIESGKTPGPHMFVTGPYLEGKGSFTPQMHELNGPDDATRTVNYWADEGVNNYKAYMHITHAELAAAVKAAHQRGLKVTGHLCSIGFREASEIGIDDLEHGLVVDTEFTPDKKPDECPGQGQGMRSLMALDVNGPEIQQTIKYLVAHHTAVTSTLPVFEISVPNRPPFDTTGASGPPQPGAPPHYLQKVLDSMTPQARIDFLSRRAQIGASKDTPMTTILQKELQFEHAFAQAGGLLLAGLDPTGYGGVVAGLGDQREVELLVEAGFTPLEAIKIATMNGATYMGVAEKIGSITQGKNADLVVIKGDPSSKISDIENVEIVFKDGVGYDASKLMDAAKGMVGLH